MSCYSYGRFMGRASHVTARPGKKPGEFVLELPPAWELRLRRVLRAQLPTEVAEVPLSRLSETERQSRLRARAKAMRSLICQVLAELVMADIVGREVALQTRSYYGSRRGNLREEVEHILRTFRKAEESVDGNSKLSLPPKHPRM